MKMENLMKKILVELNKYILNPNYTLECCIMLYNIEDDNFNIFIDLIFSNIFDIYNFANIYNTILTKFDFIQFNTFFENIIDTLKVQLNYYTLSKNQLKCIANIINVILSNFNHEKIESYMLKDIGEIADLYIGKFIKNNNNCKNDNYNFEILLYAYECEKKLKTCENNF